ncbi:class I SAM-dependent RNA methyltransferase [Nitriliruptoraceae bacterium ZYF776]|nr:class I SAM-dependent RNA methyltransferase [Profundirhabdus halotolerans]
MSGGRGDRRGRGGRGGGGGRGRGGGGGGRDRRPHVPLSREPLTATVDGFTHGGEGVARVEGKAVFVPGTLPGEQVVLRVVDDRPSWARAELVEVTDPSPDRVAPPCPHATVCGGCDLQHAAPTAQRRLKTRVVREQLQRLGKVVDPPVADCLAVGPDLGYRTHAQLHADDDGRLGFHRAGTHDVVPVEVCPILTPETQAVRAAVGDDTGAAEVAVRAHARTGTAAASLTPGPGGLAIPEGDFDLVLVQPDGSTLAMRGDGVLREEVAGTTYGFDTSSFFQVTTGGAEALVAAVLEAAGDVDGALVWDLYAGVGLLSLALARAGAEVVAVEGHAPAAAWCERNAADAELMVDVHARPVEDLVREAAAGDGDLDPPDVIVLDPPRSGAGEAVARDLATLAPGTLVYVACDVAALARDTRTLTAHGFRLTSAQPLDLFPMTHHVEVVATFVR